MLDTNMNSIVLFILSLHHFKIDLTYIEEFNNIKFIMHNETICIPSINITLCDMIVEKVPLIYTTKDW